MSDEKARCPSIDGSPDGSSGQAPVASVPMTAPTAAAAAHARPSKRNSVHSHRPRGKRTTSRGRMTLSAPMMERHWSGGSGQKSPPDVYELFLFSREADQVEVGKLLQHERELHGPLGEREVKQDRSHPSSTASSPSMWFRTLMK